MTKHPWVVVKTESNGSQTLLCKRCQQSYTPALPIPLNLFLGLLKRFHLDHKNCEEREAAS